MEAPLAITHSSTSTFLSHLLSCSSTSARKDIIIICSPRTTFLREILLDLNIPCLDIPPLTENDNPQALKMILQTPIAALIKADNVRVVYCPTIHHLRAFISSLGTSDEEAGEGGYLAVHSLLPLHHLSTEWSAQGISRTLAAIVAAGVASKRRVVVGVSRDSGVFGADAEVPLVNSRMMKNNSKKRGFYGGEGFEEEEEGGRDMRFIGSVRGVLERWFRVVGVEELEEGEGDGMMG
ncbi:hypothetical protein TWF481_010243 [Arthrobotrys musiformis]|uniref:Uncharacterized protein n=1 Tax=Arthrobotrys musiformis TaxID=47236 RepID=A0AAV9W0B1_9PEZI